MLARRIRREQLAKSDCSKCPSARSSSQAAPFSNSSEAWCTTWKVSSSLCSISSRLLQCQQLIGAQVAFVVGSCRAGKNGSAKVVHGAHCSSWRLNVVSWGSRGQGFKVSQVSRFPPNRRERHRNFETLKPDSSPRIFCHDLAIAHMDNAVGIGGGFRVMGNHEHRLP